MGIICERLGRGSFHGLGMGGLANTGKAISRMEDKYLLLLRANLSSRLSYSSHEKIETHVTCRECAS